MSNDSLRREIIEVLTETQEQFGQGSPRLRGLLHRRMADALIRNALLASGDTPRDDMTVMVMLMMDQQRGTVSMNKHYV